MRSVQDESGTEPGSLRDGLEAGSGDLRDKRGSTRAGVLIALHVLLFVFSLSGFFSKNAAAQPFMSVEFVALYAGMLFILGVYAVGWQQILKRLSLTVAFANKAVTIVWGIVWGVLFFGETLTWQMVAGACIVIAGVVLFSIADGEDQREADEKAVDS